MVNDDYLDTDICSGGNEAAYDGLATQSVPFDADWDAVDPGITEGLDPVDVLGGGGRVDDPGQDEE